MSTLFRNYLIYVLLWLPAATIAESRLPVFDAHLHYSEDDVQLTSDLNGLRLLHWTDNMWQDDTCQPPPSITHNLAQNQISLPLCQLGRFALFGPTQRV